MGVVRNVQFLVMSVYVKWRLSTFLSLFMSVAMKIDRLGLFFWLCVFVCEWVSKTFSFLPECVFVLLLFFFHFSSLASLFSISLFYSVCPTGFHVGCSGILSVHKDNDFRVSKEEKVAWLKSPAFNCRMQIPSHSRQTAPLTPWTRMSRLTFSTGININV